MKYDWMFPISLMMGFSGGYNLFDNLLIGILFILNGFILLVLKWKLQEILK